MKFWKIGFQFTVVAVFFAFLVACGNSDDNNDHGGGNVSAPGDPTLLDAAALQSGGVSLTWQDNSENESGFEIERSEDQDAASFMLLATVGTDTTQYLDIDTTDTTYHYRVRAFNGAGYSDYSDVVAILATSPQLDVTVAPSQISDVLVNPGMGVADFHFGWWCNLPPVTYDAETCATRGLDHWPENYPRAGTAYFRWYWKDLEPVRGQLNTDLIDTTILSAHAAGETLGFRVMVIDDSGGGSTGLPDWLTVDGETIDGIFWPDIRDTTFQSELQRFVQLLGARYNNHPGVDHVDIGSVGCWGEWNTACLSSTESIIEVYNPANETERNEIVAAYKLLIDQYVDAFPDTPVVMLGISGDVNEEVDIFTHAIESGTGWRVDCWGDWNMWSNAWSHQTTIYPDMIAKATSAYPQFVDTWKHAPIQLEVCGTMEGWYSLGYSTDAPDGEVYKSFQWAKEQHASVLNAKQNPIPSAYVSALDDLLVENGYRFVINSFSHNDNIDAGGTLNLISGWSNTGVAPSYIRRTLTYRLRSSTHTEMFESLEDIRTWLPGQPWDVAESFVLPANIPSGEYELEVAILDRTGTDPVWTPLPPISLGIAGRRDDGWYPVSQVSIN